MNPEAEAFYRLVDSFMISQPGWFTEVETPAADVEIAVAEAALGLALPIEYKSFLRRFGGGYFAQINVLTVGEASDWNIVRCNEVVPKDRSFLAVTDDETGAYYGFKYANGVCSPEIYHLDPEVADPPEFVARNFFVYVEEVGLRGVIKPIGRPG
ncbi:hypothetical protein QO010_000015 [Caulobacter ginsengisoli]|uniref:Knr4/Smi1-like domain-containing protein n=1 Tax=Caulobacter ginsengisoli TaxID=400775 RepID=A0ABU0IJS2_9CAUL|nr:SMI1/KNR4 family protein [Caulobacter ginsengisoli]MDQ0462267.1 hypothetical protein [Caulobacter ginsengisoli]